MRIAWYLGFGWLSIVTVVLCGIAINRLGGPIAWALYVPFLLAGLYMTVRFRLFRAEPWRRVHARAMITYGRLAGREYDAAKIEGRVFDIRIPCRGVAGEVLAGRSDQEIEALLGDGRKVYYNGLVDACPEVFVRGIPEERRGELIAGVHRDVAASELGPDVLIALAIERKHGRHEAARYLHALLLGRVR